MSLNDKEKEIWEKLESELLAEESIRKADKDMGKAATIDAKKLVLGVVLVFAGMIGLIISVMNQSIFAGIAAFGIMLYGGLFTYDHLSKLKFDAVPKNTGFGQAYQNLKNYKPGDRYW
jgi:hypothetical protein